MNETTRRIAAPPGLAWSTEWIQALFETQRAQFDALFTWQRSIAAVQQELWDEWACRFAGGVPIDG